MRLLQLREGGARHVERRVDVVVDEPLEVLDGVLRQLGEFRQHAGVVDEHVELAERVDGGLHARFGRFLIADVPGEHGDLDIGVLLADVVGDLIERVVGEAAEEDVGAFAGELVGDGFADAGAGAGDDGRLSFEAFHRGSGG